MRGGFAAPYRIPFQQQDPEIEKQMLKNQAQILRQELGSIEKHLSEILKGTASQQQT
jgi:RNA polymerase-interacting CarD/CdnL/TRCF family regulator